MDQPADSFYGQVKDSYSVKRLGKLLLDGAISLTLGRWIAKTLKAPPVVRQYMLTELIVFPAVEYTTTKMIPSII